MLQSIQLVVAKCITYDDLQVIVDVARSVRTNQDEQRVRMSGRRNPTGNICVSL